ncbi:MAG: hypothetical protein WAT58_03000 [Candidatus Dormiibacterota bacterium]
MASGAFDPLRSLGVLNAHKVDFVVIGGFAAALWGSPSVTVDVDVCYSREEQNLEALAGALGELQARLRGVDEDLPFLLDAKTLELGDHFTFETDAGPLDCLGTPKGSGGFAALSRAAIAKDLGDGLVVKVAAIEDIMLMKRAAGRPKDLIELEVLGALRDEIEKRGQL